VVRSSASRRLSAKTPSRPASFSRSARRRTCAKCAARRRHHEKLLLGFEGVATPEAARELVGAEIFGEAGEIVLGKDEYLDADLIGLRLIDPAGGDLGTVASVRHFPAQDCLVVGERGALVPMVKAFIKRVDLVARTIDVELPEGLLEG